MMDVQEMGIPSSKSSPMSIGLTIKWMRLMCLGSIPFIDGASSIITESADITVFITNTLHVTTTPSGVYAIAVKVTYVR